MNYLIFLSSFWFFYDWKTSVINNNCLLFSNSPLLFFLCSWSITLLINQFTMRVNYFKIFDDILVCRENRWLAVMAPRSAFGYSLVQEREKKEKNTSSQAPSSKKRFHKSESEHLREASRVLIISLIYYLRGWWQMEWENIGLL